MEEVKLDPSGFEKALEMLVKRKLIIKGVGYTGADALYNMLYDTYVIPLRGVQGTRRLLNIAKLLKQGKVNFFEAVYLLQPDKGTEAEQRIMKLVTQTPLSVPELVRCFENDVRDVSSADKVISAIYTEESDNQARLNNACSLSNHRQNVLAVADRRWREFGRCEDVFFLPTGEQAAVRVSRGTACPRAGQYS